MFTTVPAAGRWPMTVPSSAWSLTLRGVCRASSPAAVSRLYDRLPDFQRLLRSLDPDGKFRNKFIDTYVPADQ